MARARGIKQPHPLLGRTIAIGRSRGIKQRHPLGSVRSRSGVSQLTAESGIATSTLPGVKISALPAAGAANDIDQIEVNQAGTSRRVTLDQVIAMMSGATGFAPTDSPVFTGDPTAPTPPPGDDDQSLPTTEWVNDTIDAAISEIPASGTTILDGSGPPADETGEVGDYYVDDAGNAMYGPKSSGISYGDPQNAYPPALTPNPGFSHATIEVYSFVKVTKVGQITAVKFWYDNLTTQTSFKVNVWSTVGGTAGTRLGTATVAASGATGWRTATLVTPVDVVALDVVCVSVGFTNAYSRKDGEAFPITNGGDISATLGGYAIGLDAYPGAGASTAINFYVDGVFREAISLAWPVAIAPAPGWVQITQAEYDALSPPDPDTLYVVVG